MSQRGVNSITAWCTVQTGFKAYCETWPNFQEEEVKNKRIRMVAEDGYLLAVLSHHSSWLQKRQLFPFNHCIL